MAIQALQTFLDINFLPSVVAAVNLLKITKPKIHSQRNCTNKNHQPSSNALNPIRDGECCLDKRPGIHWTMKLYGIFSILKNVLNAESLFTYVLTKNCDFVCNFGDEEPCTEEIPDAFIPMNSIDIDPRILGPRWLDKRENYQVYLVLLKSHSLIMSVITVTYMHAIAFFIYQVDSL